MMKSIFGFKLVLVSLVTTYLVALVGSQAVLAWTNPGFYPSAPIGNAAVYTPYPTFTWTDVGGAFSYINVCIGVAPTDCGSCVWTACSGGTNCTSYTPVTNPLSPGVTYNWTVYGQVNGTANYYNDSCQTLHTVNTAPTFSGSGVWISSSVVNPDASTPYTITVSADSVWGGSNISHEYAMIDYQGENPQPHGFLSWYYANPSWPGQIPCTGNGLGYAAIQAGYGNTYLNLQSCTNVITGNNRTTTFVVTFNPSFGTDVPVIMDNDISGIIYTGNGGYGTAWTNFQTNFSITPPACNGATPSTADWVTPLNGTIPARTSAVSYNTGTRSVTWTPSIGAMAAASACALGATCNTTVSASGTTTYGATSLTMATTPVTSPLCTAKPICVVQKPGTPTAPTATGIARYAATLNWSPPATAGCTYDASTCSACSYDYSVAYGTSPNPTSATWQILGPSGTEPTLSFPLSGLSCNTLYHYRIKRGTGYTGVESDWSADATFTTGSCVAYSCLPRHAESTGNPSWTSYLTKVATSCSSGCSLGTSTIYPVAGATVTDFGNHSDRIYVSTGNLNFAGTSQLLAGGVIAGGNVSLSTDLGPASLTTPALKVVVNPGIYLAPLTGALTNAGVSHVIWREVNN